MRDDLGTGPREVHAAAAQVLAFWFDELAPEQHWTKDADLDRTIGTRFGALRNALLASDAAGWREDRDARLAAVIVLDQFSRNIHRDKADAFAGDPLALELCLTAIAAGDHRDMDAVRRGFLYMPLMHAEDRGVARFSLRRFSEPGLEDQRDFAVEHAEVVARFGRYPTRNAALGRTSTPEELAYLSQPGVGW